MSRVVPTASASTRSKATKRVRFDTQSGRAMDVLLGPGDESMGGGGGTVLMLPKGQVQATRGVPWQLYRQVGRTVS